MIVICSTVLVFFVPLHFFTKQNFHVDSINASQFVAKNYSNAQLC